MLVTDWESQLTEQVHELARQIDEQFPYRPGYYLKYDSNFDITDFSDNNAYLRFTNFRYVPTRYFAED